MLRDGFVAFVTVDSSGQPRIRTVQAFVDSADPARPSSGVTVWIKTRMTTRKVEQARRHSQVALYFNDDPRGSYASIMGTAVVHTDPNDPGVKRHLDEKTALFFWPEFPRGFVMIEVRPRWLEYIGPGFSNDSVTWRPQSVVFPQ
jgi:general stress protein 26